MIRHFSPAGLSITDIATMPAEFRNRALNAELGWEEPVTEEVRLGQADDLGAGKRDPGSGGYFRC